MEKINTPLQMAIEKLQDRLEKISNGVPPTSIHNERKLTRESEIRTNLQILKSLLPAEREVIEKAYESGQNSLLMTDPNAPCAKDYFTQTFKSYE